MPALHLTISAWYAIAVVIQFIWIFTVVNFSTRFWSKRGRYTRARKIAAVIGGPLVWVIYLDDAFRTRRARQRKDRILAVDKRYGGTDD